MWNNAKAPAVLMNGGAFVLSGESPVMRRSSAEGPAAAEGPLAVAALALLLLLLILRLL